MIIINKKIFFLKKKIKKIDKELFSKNYNLVGRFYCFFLKKKIAITLNHPISNINKSLFIKLQIELQKCSEYIDQSKLKEMALLKIKKVNGYKNLRIERNLPLRGQRTRTNAKTRKKKNIL